MKFVFIIPFLFLGITAAQAQQGQTVQQDQTVLQPTGQTNSNASAVGSDPLGVPTPALPSVSSSSPASQFGTPSESPTATGSTTTGPTTTGSASGATGSSPPSSTGIPIRCG